jgi:hypothetical protein
MGICCYVILCTAIYIVVNMSILFICPKGPLKGWAVRSQGAGATYKKVHPCEFAWVNKVQGDRLFALRFIRTP